MTLPWFSLPDAPRPPREVTVERDESIAVRCAPYTARLIPPSTAEIQHDDGRCARFPFAALPHIGRISEMCSEPMAAVALTLEEFKC